MNRILTKLYSSSSRFTSYLDGRGKNEKKGNKKKKNFSLVA